MNFLHNLKPSTAHYVREQIEDEGAMWANKWYALMKPLIWLASYFAFYTYSEGSFNFRRLPLSGQIVYLGQKLFKDKKTDEPKRRKTFCGLGIGANFYGGNDGADRSFQFHIKLIFFAVYLTFENILPKRFQPHYQSKHGYGAMPTSREFRFYYHDRAIWLNFWDNEDDYSAKQKWINQMHVFHLPWAYVWVRTSKLLANGEWFTETYKNRMSWKEKDALEKQQNLFKESHPYQYKLRSGEIQNVTATIGVSEREWRWRWFKWLGFPKQISRTLDIDFSEEVGEERGSWKGGTLGCSYKMLKNESPLDCLRRMEKERKFER